MELHVTDMKSVLIIYVPLNLTGLTLVNLINIYKWGLNYFSLW
jgi:hypothetical protein